MKKLSLAGLCARCQAEPPTRNAGQANMSLRHAQRPTQSSIFILMRIIRLELSRAESACSVTLLLLWPGLCKNVITNRQRYLLSVFSFKIQSQYGTALDAAQMTLLKSSASPTVQHSFINGSIVTTERGQLCNGISYDTSICSGKARRDSDEVASWPLQCQCLKPSVLTLPQTTLEFLGPTPKLQMTLAARVRATHHALMIMKQ